MGFIEKENVTKIGEKWAIIIGISKYQESHLNLEYADRDAQDFYDILIQPKEGFFKAKNIIKLINEDASSRKINKALKQFLKNPDTDDLVLIYFACHGAYDPDRPKNTYLLPYDTELDDIAGTGVEMSEIDNSIKKNLLAKKTIVIADACHSGNIGGNFGRRSMQSAGNCK